MKQILKSLRTGKTMVTEVPTPKAGQGMILVQTAVSLVSAGTERLVADFAEKSLLAKARSRPDLVRQTLDKAKREGILTTAEAVFSRLAQPLALGYSCAGTVLDPGGVAGLQVGQRVACAGAGYASHAEAVAVPKNLVVKLPEAVDFESGSFTTLGAIALQGIRLAEVKLGELIAVIGLGLLGQLAVQMLKAAGCTVVGLDIQPERAALARQLGADGVATTPGQLASLCRSWSGGAGADAVLITADTKSSEPLEVAGEVARDRAQVVLVGAVGMSLPRKIYFEKELGFRVSRSYGPGRYDPEYEEKGQDYPIGYVRWTENRNMQAFVQFLAHGQVNVRPLISHRFPILEAPKAYELISGNTGEPFLGVLLTYPETPDLGQKIALRQPPQVSPAALSRAAGSPHLARVRLGVLGAGNFATATLLPALKKVAPLELVNIASSGGVSARAAADRFGFAHCTTDPQELLADPSIDAVAVLTRHHLHAPQVIAALQAGKHVFVEKPLCLKAEELAAIIAAYQDSQNQAASAAEAGSAPYLMVGFNRRFAPFVLELKGHLRQVQEPLMLHYRVNAGYVPPNHWTQDPEQGGGRLLGEGCHFIDLLIYLAGAGVRRVTCQALPDQGGQPPDNFLVVLEFANGSLGTILYAAGGDKGFGKEVLEVFGGGLAARLDDFRSLDLRQGRKRVRRWARLRQDKGHAAEWLAFTAFLTGKGPEPMTFAEAVHATEVTLAAHLSLAANEPVVLVNE
jgi:predicted dehydrogenase